MTRNFNLNKRAFFNLCLGGTLILSGCSEVDVTDDFCKSFNVIVESNGFNISVVGVKSYSNYGTNQIQFMTEDGLKVVVSMNNNVQLLNIKDEKSFNNYIAALSFNDSNNVINYNELQGIDINYNAERWNKDIFGSSYSYDKAIILSEGVATIVDLNSCVTSNEKIQLKLSDDTVVLTNIENVKLINDQEASSDSLKNYAISLVGDCDKVVFYNGVKSK